MHNIQSPSNINFTIKLETHQPHRRSKSPRSSPFTNQCFTLNISYAFVASTLQNSQPAATDAHLYAGADTKPATCQLCKIGTLIVGIEGNEWFISANEIGRSAQGVGQHMPKETNKIFLIDPSLKSFHTKSTYIRIVATD